MTDDFWSTKALLFPIARKAGTKAITTVARELASAKPWAARSHIIPQRCWARMAAGVTQGWKPAMAMWRRWGWRLGSLHMHQQHAPGASMGITGAGQAGHHVMLLAPGGGWPAGRHRRCWERRPCIAHGQDPPSPLPGPASVTISIRVFSPNTGTQNTQLVGAPRYHNPCNPRWSCKPDRRSILPKLGAHNLGSQAPQSWKPSDQETTKAPGTTISKTTASQSQGQGEWTRSLQVLNRHMLGEGPPGSRSPPAQRA